jgi:hypothetical protein
VRALPPQPPAVCTGAIHPPTAAQAKLRIRDAQELQRDITLAEEGGLKVCARARGFGALIALVRPRQERASE